MTVWLVLLITALAFGFGFALSWRRMRRQLQARMDQQVEAEIRRQIKGRVMDELHNGRLQETITQAAEDVNAQSIRNEDQK